MSARIPYPSRSPVTPGIRAIGRAVPRYRLNPEEAANAWGAGAPRDTSALAVPAFDEDETTLAAEAARRALDAAGIRGRDLGLIAYATTYVAADATVLAEYLDARTARLLETSGAATLGLNTLLTAIESVAATRRHALAIVSDIPRRAPGHAAEPREGAAAVAYLVSPEGGVRITQASAASRDPARRDHMSHGHLRGPDVATADDLLAEAIENLALRGNLDFVASANPAPGAGGKPLEPRNVLLSVRDAIGDSGAADAALHLAEALATSEPGTRGLAIEQRGGAALALLVEVDRAPAGARSIAEESTRGKRIPYLRAVQERGALLDLARIPEESMGAYAPFQEYADALPARYRLEAARCTACGRLAYPPRAACPGCAGRAFEAVPLSGRATLDSFTVIGRGGAPSEFAAEQAMAGSYAVGLVRFEEGPAILARLTDAEEADLEIGMALEPVLRKLYRQEGVVRYGVKFRVAGDS